MNLRTRRALNFWWALISILVVAGLAVAGYYIFKGTDWYLFFIITLILSFTIFWGFYLVFTSFKKNKYPFLTFVPEYRPTDNIFQKSLTIKFLWIWLIPTIAAIIIPIFFLIYHAVHIPESFSWKAIIAYVVVLVLALGNNLAYTITLTKQINGEDSVDEFTMRLD